MMWSVAWLFLPWSVSMLPPMVAAWQTRKVAKLLKDMGTDKPHYWFVEGARRKR